MVKEDITSKSKKDEDYNYSEQELQQIEQKNTVTDQRLEEAELEKEDMKLHAAAAKAHRDLHQVQELLEQKTI